MRGGCTKVIQGKDILEVATGPRLLAKHVSDAVHKMIATDYSDGVIQEAKKGSYPDNLIFEVADVEHLPYNDTLQTKADTVRCRPEFSELPNVKENQPRMRCVIDFNVRPYYIADKWDSCAPSAEEKRIYESLRIKIIFVYSRKGGLKEFRIF